MQKWIFLLAVVILSSCGGTKDTAKNSHRFTVENLRTYDHQKIEQEYADANAEEGSSMFDEGTVERPYTILYPNTPNELHITWKDDKRREVYDLRFSQKGDWKSDSGIKIGTTYDELNELNRKPISFYGFGWDYSGAVVWNDGKLEDTKLRIFLTPEEEPEERYYGDNIITAGKEEIEALNLRVSSIIYKNE